MLNFQPLTIEDFSGGLTDELFGASPNQCAKAENFILTNNGKLRTRFGSELDVPAPEARAKISGNTRVDALFPSLDPSNALLNKLSLGKFYYDDGSAITELKGPQAVPESAYSASIYPAWSVWNNHLFMTGAILKPLKIYLKGTADAAPSLRLRTAGLPQPGGTITRSGGTPSGAYIYAVCYKRTYRVADRAYIDRGPFNYSASMTGGGGCTVSGWTALTNGAGDHYELTGADAEVEIYRTKNGGSVLYLLATILNSATQSYTDSTADSGLSVPAYNADGSPDRDPPPACQFLHISQLGVGYYGWAQDPDSSSIYPNRVYQSIPNDPDSVPKTFYEDLDSNIRGISSYQGTPIIVCENAVYRLDGVIDQLGNGAMRPRKVASNIGGLNHNGIIQTPEGLFFCGTDGFYWTDGFKIFKISEQLNDTYRAKILSLSASDRAKAHGTYDPITRQVWWAYKDPTDSSELDAAFVLHLIFGIKPRSVFTTIKATCASVLTDNGYVYRGDNNGYTFRHKLELKTDPRVDTGANVSTWGTSTIRYDFRTGYLDFGSVATRKWTPGFIVGLKAEGNLSIQPAIDRDGNNTPENTKEIKHTGQITWGGAGVLWGDERLWAADNDYVERKVALPSPGIRCTYRQYRLANAYTVIANSDTLATATVSFAAKIATLDDNSNGNFPSDALDYYIHFANDSYIKAFLITGRTDTVITFTDPDNVAPNGSYKWMIKGYSKGQVCNLLHLTPLFAFLTPTQQPFRAAETGENA